MALAPIAPAAATEWRKDEMFQQNTNLKGIINEYINHKNFKMGKSSPLKRGPKLTTLNLARYNWGFGVSVPNLFDWLYSFILRILTKKLWKMRFKLSICRRKISTSKGNKMNKYVPWKVIQFFIFLHYTILIAGF